MKIYFACSIRGGRDDADLYGQLAAHIKTRGELLTEIFADGKLTADGMQKPVREIWSTDMNWIAESDAIIAEVTNPSLGVGYEIAKAEEMGKPVLALFRDTSERKLSAMIDGSQKTTTVRYRELSQAMLAIDRFIGELERGR